MLWGARAEIAVTGAWLSITVGNPYDHCQREFRLHLVWRHRITIAPVFQVFRRCEWAGCCPRRSTETAAPCPDLVLRRGLVHERHIALPHAVSSRSKSATARSMAFKSISS